MSFLSLKTVGLPVEQFIGTLVFTIVSITSSLTERVYEIVLENKIYNTEKLTLYEPKNLQKKNFT